MGYGAAAPIDDKCKHWRQVTHTFGEARRTGAKGDAYLRHVNITQNSFNSADQVNIKLVSYKSPVNTNQMKVKCNPNFLNHDKMVK